MAKHEGRRYKGWRKNSGRSTPVAKPKFVAPMSGREDVYFTTGSIKDAAAFQDTVHKLARRVSTAAGWKQGPTLGKVMTNLRDPVFDQPTRPVRMYFDNVDGTATKAWAMSGKKNVKVMDDLNYAIETREQGVLS